MRVDYAVTDKREQFRMASENPMKMAVIHRLIKQHEGDNIMVIGQYLNQLDLLAEEFKAPIITGKTPQKEREEIYSAFRSGRRNCIIVSKVANSSIDLPDANVVIQVSGTFAPSLPVAMAATRAGVPRPVAKEPTAPRRFMWLSVPTITS